MPSNMYTDTVTWNPAVGCLYDCVYCEKSFKRMLKRVAGTLNCPECYTYTPHYHPERLGKIPSGKKEWKEVNVFVFGTGDISFYDPSFVRKTFRAIDKHKPRKEKTYLFQSKNPVCFNQYLPWFNEHEHDVVLLTTLETNRNEGYELVSSATLPVTRFYDFYDLEYSRKVVTIEPVLDFDLEIFVTWMNMLRNQGSLEYVWFGYDSKRCGLPEPSEEKSQSFVDMLQDYGIEVRGKTLKGVKIKG